MATKLKTGEYVIPDDCSVKKVGKTILVYKKKIKRVDSDRCRYCKHFGTGPTIMSSEWWTSCVCFKKPKGVGITGKTIYYSANPYGKVCELFEQKDEQK